MYAPKVPVIIKPDYCISLARYNGAAIAHCDVYRWAPSVYKALVSDFNLLVYLHDDPIYAYHEIGDKKHKKFLDLLDFKFVQNITGTDLKLRELYLRK